MCRNNYINGGQTRTPSLNNVRMCLCVHTRGVWSEHDNTRDFTAPKKGKHLFINTTQRCENCKVSNRNFLVRKSLCGCDHSTVSSRAQVIGCLKIKYLLANSDNGLTPCSRIFMKILQFLNESRISKNLWNPNIHYRACKSPSLFSVIN